MTQKHTPEPWNYVIGDNEVYVRQGGLILAKMRKDLTPVENAARIVACVNEFAGKTNEEVKGYVEAMDAMYKNYCNLQAENILLKEQIEKLKEGK